MIGPFECDGKNVCLITFQGFFFGISGTFQVFPDVVHVKENRHAKRSICSSVLQTIY